MPVEDAPMEHRRYVARFAKTSRATPQASLECALVEFLAGELLTEHLFEVRRPVQRTGVRGQYPVEVRLHYCPSP